MDIVIPPEITDRTASLRQRAASLRSQAGDLPEVLGQAYRRRAAEVELEAWALEIRAGAPTVTAA